MKEFQEVNEKDCSYKQREGRETEVQDVGVLKNERTQGSPRERVRHQSSMRESVREFERGC